MKKTVLLLLKFYQFFFSPVFPSCCRFYPTCSDYATEAVKRFGVWRGLLLACWRVLRCHPWHPGGYDPVPRLFPKIFPYLRHLFSMKEKRLWKRMSF